MLSLSAVKNLLWILFALMTLTACEKAKEDIAEDIIVKAMTDGQWTVTRYIKGSADLTADFNPYKFQFYSNNSVDAIKTSGVESRGTWQADINNRTIFSQFQNTSPTLLLLNGTWKITRNSWAYVEATQVVNGEERSLRLDK